MNELLQQTDELIKRANQILSTHAVSWAEASPDRSLNDHWQGNDGGPDNLFDILGLGHKEIIHSRLLGYLLNPNANHGHSDTFLELFLKAANIKGFNSRQTRVVLEKHIPVSNRRIDIYLTDGVNRIIIENKIWATDQKCQLADYFEYGLSDSKHLGKLTILYLTLEGADPSFGSMGCFDQQQKMQPYLKAVSYRDLIHPWIEECMGRIVTKSEPLLHSLKQYKANLQTLLSMKTSVSDNQLKKLILSPDYSLVAFEIHQQFASVKKAHIKHLWRTVVEELRDVLTRKGWRVGFYPGKDETYLILTRESIPGIGLSFEDLYELKADGSYFAIYYEKKTLIPERVDRIGEALRISEGLSLENDRDGIYLTWQKLPSGLRFTTARNWQMLVEDFPAKKAECESFVLQQADRYEKFFERCSMADL